MSNAGSSFDVARHIVLAADVDRHDLGIDAGNLPCRPGADRTPWIMEEHKACLIRGRCEKGVKIEWIATFGKAGVFHGILPEPKAAHPLNENVTADQHGSGSQDIHRAGLSLGSILSLGALCRGRPAS